jgi:hypothetical protein
MPPEDEDKELLRNENCNFHILCLFNYLKRYYQLGL